MFTDTHAHLCWPEFATDLPQVIDRARVAGVTRIVTIGTSPANAPATVAIAAPYDGVYAAVGLHPGDVPAVGLDDIQSLRRYAVSEKVVAIGEIGLDYYRLGNTTTAERTAASGTLAPPAPTDGATGTLAPLGKGGGATVPVAAVKQRQIDLFRAQLELARELHLPVVIHNRDSETDMRQILTVHAGGVGQESWPWGVMHCFAGDATFAFDCIERGLLISFAGILTFKNAAAMRDVARQIPLEHLLIETDAPYLAPVPHRGRRNEPAYIPLIAAALAGIKGVSVEAVARATTANAARLFRWPDIGA